MPHHERKAMKVGELAKATGVSVRTLHYYDEIGLLQPSSVTGSGHRVYGANELARLQQIKSLRQLGFSLDQVRTYLDTPGYSPRGVIALHVERLREQIDRQQRLVALLETLDRELAASSPMSPDDFVRAIQSMTLVEQGFTPEEMAEIRQRGERAGREHVRAVEREWPVLIAQVRAEMLAGTDAASERMRPLVARWRALVREFTGGNPSIERKVRAAFVSEPRRMAAAGLDPELFAYVNTAIRALDS